MTHAHALTPWSPPTPLPMPLRPPPLPPRCRPPQVLASLPVLRLRRSTLFVDVLSVKEFPKSLLLRELPPECDILCTHPMFGPDSGAVGEGGAVGAGRGGRGGCCECVCLCVHVCWRRRWVVRGEV